MAGLGGIWKGVLIHLWQTTLVLCVLFAFERALQRAPARVTHTLWSVGLIKLFLPLSLLSGAARRALTPLLESTAQSGAAASALSVVSVILDPSVRFGSGGETALVIPAALVIFTLVWGITAGIIIARIVGDTMRISITGEQKVDALPADLLERFRSVLESTGIPEVHVRIVPGMLMPYVSGFIKPRIRIPRHLVETLTGQEMSAILLHEEYHRRRLDPLRSLIGRISCALFFFYPLIYPVLKRLQSTAEFACDEGALDSGIPAVTYSHALARTFELALAPAGHAAGAGGGGKSLIGRRLDRLSDEWRYTMTRKHRFILAAAAILVAAGSFVPLPMQAALDGSDGSLTNVTPISEALPEEKEKEDKTDTKPEPIEEYMTMPVYPAIALKSGVEAKVFMKVLIDEKGLVEKAEPEKIHLRTGTDDIYEATIEKDTMENQEVIEAFTKAATDAIMKWRFKPAELNGKPVAIETLIPVHFKMH